MEAAAVLKWRVAAGTKMARGRRAVALKARLVCGSRRIRCGSSGMVAMRGRSGQRKKPAATGAGCSKQKTSESKCRRMKQQQRGRRMEAAGERNERQEVAQCVGQEDEGRRRSGCTCRRQGLMTGWLAKQWRDEEEGDEAMAGLEKEAKRPRQRQQDKSARAAVCLQRQQWLERWLVLTLVG